MHTLALLICLAKPPAVAPAPRWEYPTFQLPDRECAVAGYQLADSHMDAAKLLYSVSTPRQQRDMEEEMAEREALLKAWRHLAQIRSKFSYFQTDQTAQLRALIGPENYDLGVMPPPVPYWRYADTR